MWLAHHSDSSFTLGNFTLVERCSVKNIAVHLFHKSPLLGNMWTKEQDWTSLYQTHKDLWCLVQGLTKVWQPGCSALQELQDITALGCWALQLSPSRGLHSSHHTALWSEAMTLWSTFTGFFCLHYLFRYVHSPQHLTVFFSDYFYYLLSFIGTEWK